jgi:ubiquinone/menaquinone biosynthesis C-methylase UbiE
VADGSKSHPIFARFWVFISEREDAAGQHEYRRELLAGARGRVLEIGAGNGRNFKHYPDTVDEVVAIEPEPHLRERAAEAAHDAAVRVEVAEGTDSPLPFTDDSFDVAVVSLVLCSVPDQARALAELRRVLKPGAELRFYEHVVPEKPGWARFFRFLEKSGIWPFFGAGCHPARDTRASIERAGFAIEQIRRFQFNKIPHILGLARA